MKKVSNRLYLTQKIIDYIGVVFLGLLLLFIWQLYRGPIELPFLKPYMVPVSYTHLTLPTNSRV